MFGLPPDRLLTVLGALEGRTIMVYPGQCTRLRHRRSNCAICSEVCPTQAIHWGDSLRVNREACTGCGLCASLCPTGALEAQSPTDLELVQRVRDRAVKEGLMVFICPRYLESQGKVAAVGLQVNCLGRLDESILVGAVAWGAKELLLVDGACRECPQGSGRGAAEKAVERARTLLQCFGVSPRISFVSDPPRKGGSGESDVRAGDVSRRDLFAFLVGRARQTASVAVGEAIGGRNEERLTNKGELPVRVPAKRRLLLAALKRLGKPASPLVKGTELWAQFAFSEACTGCQMCAYFCPTGALTRAEKDGNPALLFKVDLCTHCLLCRDLCYRKAVTLSPVLDLGPVVEGSSQLLPMPKPASRLGGAWVPKG